MEYNLKDIQDYMREENTLLRQGSLTTSWGVTFITGDIVRLLVINEQIQVITEIEIEAEVRKSRREERNRDKIPTTLTATVSVAAHC
jgi:hypothetical protein